MSSAASFVKVCQAALGARADTTLRAYYGTEQKTPADSCVGYCYEQAGGDAATQEAAPVANDSDDEMGRELFGNGDAGADEDMPTAAAAVPAEAPSALRREPPAPAVSVCQLSGVMH